MPKTNDKKADIPTFATNENNILLYSQVVHIISTDNEAMLIFYQVTPRKDNDGVLNYKPVHNEVARIVLPIHAAEEFSTKLADVLVKKTQ